VSIATCRGDASKLAQPAAPVVEVSTIRCYADQMDIRKGRVVCIEYTLRNKDGQVLDTSEGSEPLEYLHGHGQIVPGLELALEGAQDGESRQVVVSAAQGYGQRDEKAVFAVGRSMFPPDMEIATGETYIGRDTQGNPVPVTVVSIEADQVVVDANHPLAGQELHFEVTVRGVRDATAEELSHGHIHGSDHPTD